MSISTVRSSMGFGHTDRGFHLRSHTAMTSGRLLIFSGTELPYLQYACVLYRVCLCDPMNCSQQAPLSMSFPRQEYWRGLPFPPPGDLPDPMDQTHVSRGTCTSKRILNHWVTWEALSAIWVNNISLIVSVWRLNNKWNRYK